MQRQLPSLSMRTGERAFGEEGQLSASFSSSTTTLKLTHCSESSFHSSCDPPTDRANVVSGAVRLSEVFGAGPVRQTGFVSREQATATHGRAIELRFDDLQVSLREEMRVVGRREGHPKRATVRPGDE